MKNSKTTILGLVVGALLAAWAVLQPAITGGAIDYKILIPAVAIAIVGFLQKDSGSWKTTTVGIVLAALAAGAAAYQSDPNQWALVIGAILSAVGGALTKDHDATTA
jgi:hypothetical protein